MVGTNLGKCEWVWEEITKMAESKMAVSNSRWQNSRWLPSSSWVRMNEWSFFCANGWIQHGRIQDGCHHQVESEWMSEGFFCANGGNQSWQVWVSWEKILRWLNPRWLNPRWQNSRWLPSSSWVRMNEFESDWISLSQSQSGVRVFLSESERRNKVSESKMANVWIQHGRIQDGCHHQVEWEWMSLSQIELVWVRVRVEWECFWVNLREDNKVSESKMAVSESNMKNSRWLPSSSWVRMNEWSFFCANGGNQSWQVWVSLRGKTKMAESKMAKFKRIQDGCHHQVEWEWMSLSQIELVWVRVRVEWECFWVNLREDNKVSESKMAVSESRWLPSSSWVRMNEWSFFLCKWWEPILASVSEFERKN